MNEGMQENIVSLKDTPRFDALADRLQGLNSNLAGLNTRLNQFLVRSRGQQPPEVDQGTATEWDCLLTKLDAALDQYEVQTNQLDAICDDLERLI